MWKTSAIGLFAGAVLCAGCGQEPAAPLSPPLALPAPPVQPGLPVGLQMVKTEAQLKKYPFFNLLSFESDADAVFARPDGADASLDTAAMHTGRASLKLQPGCRSLIIKLASLHSGREWPGPWTLVGAYFRSEHPQRLTAALEMEGAVLEQYTVELPERQWTPVLLDVRSALERRKGATIDTLRISFAEPLQEPVWCDDLVEVNNTTPIVSLRGFAAREEGFRYVIEKPLAFRVLLKTPEAAEQGWTLQEASDVRLRFTSGAKSQTIYPDGRWYVDGQYKQLSRVAGGEALAAAHQSPASIAIPEELGRVDRNTPGDENNDGYNEREGSYALVAAGPRVEMVITPRTPLLVRPVLDIRELPAGRVMATMDGVLLERVERLPSGHVLIELPGALERPTTVNVKVTP